MKKTMPSLALLICYSPLAMASTGGSLPWESPLTSIKDSLTGPVAGSISLIAIMVCGVMLIFGGDFSGFVRGLLNVVLAISVTVGSSSLLSFLFNTSGAEIPEGVEWPNNQDLQPTLETSSSARTTIKRDKENFDE